MKFKFKCVMRDDDYKGYCNDVKVYLGKNLIHTFEGFAYQEEWALEDAKRLVAERLKEVLNLDGR